MVPICSYAGPESQLVTQKFKLDWATYLSSSENVIVAYIDGRGSRAQGDQHTYDVYKRLGTVEVQDQLTAVKYVHATESCIASILDASPRFTDRNPRFVHVATCFSTYILEMQMMTPFRRTPLIHLRNVSLLFLLQIFKQHIPLRW